MLGIGACAKKTLFSGDHPTHLIRSMWSHCLNSFQKVNPLFTDDTVAPYCDCLVDQARINFKFLDYATALDTEKSFSDFADTCVKKLGVITIPTIQ